MKSIKMLMMAALTIVSVSLFAQDSPKQNAKETTQKTEQLKYSCPMKCESDKTYEKSGKCPKCNMNLKEVASASDAFACPMKCEGDKTYVKPGKCPECGMNLKKVEKIAKSFACPMKCEGNKTYTKMGSCPKCGMNLKEKKEDHSGHNH